MRNNFRIFISIITLLALNINNVDACTNIIVTKGASADGSVMISYSADSHTRYGVINFSPAANHPAGSIVNIYDYEKGGLRGTIPQVPFTYSAIGHTNQYQLAIGETTFGGREELVNKEGILDYGSLIYLTLQRAKTAREAILLMDKLVQEHGYGSMGESFSIADKNEVWIMEIIGKGAGNKGAVWVAQRIPDGAISAHANHARITTFPLNDPENTLYSKDVISFARSKGYFNGEDKDFSFSDTYAPINFSAMRGCEARVWSVFNMFGTGMDKYLDYAMGHNEKNRMPLWITPNKKLTVADVATAMRDHYEGTPMDMTTDAGAGGEQCPYRWRPMEFEYEGNKYVNERAIATQQTGFWFITQSRSRFPDEIGGVNWFGVDDAATSCLSPIYMSSYDISEHIKIGNGSIIEYSPTASFWIFNRVAQFAYLRYNTVGKAAQEWAHKFESDCFAAQLAIEQTAMELYKSSPEKARQFLTDYSLGKSHELFNTWNKLDRYLMTKYIDGNVKKEENGKFKTNGTSNVIPASPDQPGYSEVFKKAMTNKTLLIPTEKKKKK